MSATDVAMVHIVGIGPGGDDRYLTDAARRAVSEADVVIFPGTQLGEPIRALVRGELRWGCWFEDSTIHEWVLAAMDEGQRVAWLCAGDPTLFAGQPGRFGSLAVNTAWLRAQDIGFEVHPGISSLQALLARLGLEHAHVDSGCPMVVYAPGRDPVPLARSRMESLAALGVPMALFLADEMVGMVLEICTRYFGPEGRLVVGHRIGWPDEWVIDSTLAEFAQRTGATELPQHTLLLVGPWHG
jgi:precorrin-4/cobalt-precorrin-4 C11-methyltransferase